MSKPVVPVVIDTNVLVPSLYKQTPILKFILGGNLALIWNIFIYEEAVEIIHRLSNYYKDRGIASSEMVIELLDLILDDVYQTPEMPYSWPNTSPDRDDDPFLFAAIQGSAKYIISSDKRHMLSLKNISGIPLGSPKDFFSWVKIEYPMENNNQEFSSSS